MAKVYIGFDGYGVKEVDEEFVHFVFDMVIGAVRLPPKFEAGLVITDDRRMRELNRRYRGRDKSTNVLSFVYGEVKDKFFDSDDENYLGDVYISRPQVGSGAREAGISEKDEFTRLFVHGLLHLTGIHHKNEKEAERMEGLEDEIVAKICSI